MGDKEVQLANSKSYVVTTPSVSSTNGHDRLCRRDSNCRVEIGPAWEQGGLAAVKTEVIEKSVTAD